jgi:hypothetical protein
MKLGLDNDSLQAVNPGVLFCRLDCLGGPLPGPKSNFIGYDDIIRPCHRAASVARRQRSTRTSAPLDANCGFAAGLGMAVSIYHKKPAKPPARVPRCRRSPTWRVVVRLRSITPDAAPFNNLAASAGPQCPYHTSIRRLRG